MACAIQREWERTRSLIGALSWRANLLKVMRLK